LRAHNIEHTIWERLAFSTANPLKRWYLNLLAKRLRDFELKNLNKYDGILAITKEEVAKMNAMGAGVPIALIPFGVDISRYNVTAATAADKNTLFSLAAMDWQPNIEAINWFLAHVWMKVLQQEPEAVFHLAGRNMPDEFYKLTTPNVVVHGEVPDAIHFMQRNNIMIAPLLAGGGMRVKIVEGMALGKAIVSTAIGAEGVVYTNGKDMLIADTAAEFAAAIVRLLRENELAEKLGKEAKALALSIYSTQAIGDKLEQFYISLIHSR
jgi:glycosyltransferase involved in cell wall biosynthesis